MNKYKSNPTQMGEAIVALIGGASLKIEALDGSEPYGILNQVPGCGALVTNNGVYLSELGQRCFELFGFHVTISVTAESLSVCLDSKETSEHGSRIEGWSYQSDRQGRVQIHPHAYGNIVDNLLIDMIESASSHPIYKVIDPANDRMHYQHYVAITHKLGKVRVFLDDLLSVASMSKVVLGKNKNNSVLHQSGLSDDVYTGETIRVVDCSKDTNVVNTVIYGMHR